MPDAPRDMPWWQELLDHVPELVVVADGDLVCRYASLELTPRLGWQTVDVIGHPLEQLVVPDDRDTVRSRLAGVLTGDAVARLELRLRRPSGEPCRVHASARRYRRGRANFVVVVLGAPVEGGGTRRAQVEAALDVVQNRLVRAVPAELELELGAGLTELASVVGADCGWLVEWDAGRAELAGRGTTATATTDVDPPSADALLAGGDPERTEVLADVAAAGPERAAELAAAGLTATARFPVRLGTELVGLVGFDWRDGPASWGEVDLAELARVVPTFANVVARRRAERALARSTVELAAAFEHSPSPLVVLDRDGTVTRLNGAAQDLMAWGPRLVVGRFLAELVDPVDLGRFETWSADLYAHPERALPVEARFMRGDGDAVWLRVHPSVVREQGLLAQVIVQLSDISQRKQAEAALDESEHRFRTLVDNLPDPVMRITPDMVTVFANQAARDLFEIDVFGNVRVDEATRRESVRMVRDALAARAPRRSEYRTVTRSGARVLSTRFIPELGPDGTPRSMLLVSTDLTEQRRTEAELTYRATHDALTGLPNRSLFLTHLDVSLARLRRTGGLAAVVFFDLDHFKMVNDTLGHQAGDEMLQTVAGRLRDSLRASDVVARLGGDEFTVLLDPCHDIGEVRNLVVRLQEALARPMQVGDRELIVSSSAGIALADRTAGSGEELLKWADAAMYRAKSSGRARHSIVDEDLLDEIRNRLEMDQRLRGALDRDELEVHYQPEVDLTTGEVVGAEALLRWNYDGAVLSAAAFIELAEESGQILPIGRWVLETACARLRCWQDRWPDRELTMRVNLSARQFDQPDLVEQVTEVVRASGIDAAALCLEITETALMADAAAAAAVLGRLAELGVRLAIDDFGTGYSSLNYLKRFPMDVLKIDRSFVDGLPDDPEDEAIVTTIVRLAETLGMEVTAEGVETEGQQATLVRLGCRRAQGFRFARPAPPEVVERMIGSRLPLSEELPPLEAPPVPTPVTPEPEPATLSARR